MTRQGWIALYVVALACYFLVRLMFALVFGRGPL